jgi:hypothetical protein
MLLVLTPPQSKDGQEHKVPQRLLVLQQEFSKALLLPVVLGHKAFHRHQTTTRLRMI